MAPDRSSTAVTGELDPTAGAQHRSGWPPGRLRYLLLCVALGAVLGAQTLNEQWSGDVWIHASTIREFALEPFLRRDPVLGVDAAHPLMSPYAFVLGLVSRLTGMQAITTLKVAAAGNLVLLLAGLRSFVLAVAAPRHAPPDGVTDRPDERAPFWVLLLTLCLWGPGVWRWSGLLHLGSLGFTLPFPSTFATGLALVVLAAALRGARRGPGRWLVAVGVAVPVLILTHPPTALAFAIGLAAIAIDARGPLGGRGVAGMAGVVAGGTAVAVLWPYFPVLGLRATPSFSTMNAIIYDGFAVRFGPVILLGCVPLAWRFRRDRSDPLVVIAGGSLLLVLIGWITGAGVLGRLVPFAALAFDTALGTWLASTEQRGMDAPATRTRTLVWVCALAVGLSVWGLVNGRAAVVRALPRQVLPASVRDDERLDQVSAEYGPLLAGVASEDVVLGPIADSRYVPAFAGHLAASYWENPFVADDADRRRRATRFFNQAGSDERRATLAETGTTVVLVPVANRGVTSFLGGQGWEKIADDGSNQVWRRPDG